MLDLLFLDLRLRYKFVSKLNAYSIQKRWLNISIHLNKSLYLYFYFNKFEMIYLDSVYFVGVELKSEGFLLLNC